MNYTFESTKPDGSPRQYVGMWKPPLEDYSRSYSKLRPWEIYYRPDTIRDSWLAGDGDRPLYEGDE